MHALILAVALTAPAQCPGGRCGPVELTFRSGRAAPSTLDYDPRFAPRFERPRQRSYYFETERRGILPWRYERRRYYFFDGR